MLVTAVGVRELAPLPSRSPLFATNFDGTTYAACCEEYSAAAFASRIARAADARLARDRWVPTLSREYRWGGNSKYFLKFIRAKRRFVTRENLMKNLRSFFFFPHPSEICGFRKVLDIFFGIQNVYGPILDQCFRVQI